MISTAVGIGVADAAVVRVAGAFRAPAAHLPAAPHAKRRPAAATVAFVNRGFR
ncbi:hypothetical protein [[Mycobacterium] burgundiense]|uniref:Uncharacterized protein n=1 Tax=[Mycobacterium] burgundiense TaxID=3064286 RepID=A0ABN9NPY2_9MYCO|nr:hypothetical protein [Mycolicibacterium sp. MU0053]CAJ1507375.1 hypothetical protein MU0053_003491 [Mycolicibacterium sp. MU0053]